jgi:HK97 family phage prohead protease
MSTRHIPIELRAEADGPEGTLTGYASIYEQPYSVGGGLSEVIKREAFAESVRERGGVIPLFWNHGWAKPANAVPIGVARVREDSKGLRVEAEVFMDSAEGLAVWRAAKAGALREWSIGFKADAVTQRGMTEEIDRGSLVEASVVVKGANPLTEMIGVRSEADAASEDEGDEPTPPAENEDEGTTPESDPEGTEPEGEEDETGTPPVVVEQAYGLLAHRGVRDALRPQTNQE